MKKLMIALAIVAAGAGMSLRAEEKQPQCQRQQCPTEQQCPGPQGKCDSTRRCCPMQQLFDGITLTDAQKAKIQELQQKAIADRQTKGQAMLEAKARAKAERRAARLQARKDMLAQLKTILTPEQYTQFLENSFIQGGQKSPKGPKMHGPKGRRGGRQGGPRPAPQQK